MKVLKLLIFIFVICFSGVSYGQQDKSKNRILTVDDIRAKYVFAMETKDYDVSKDALMQLLAINSKDSVVLYNLLQLYLDTKKYEACYLLSKRYLEQNRSSVQLLDYYAKTSQALGKYSEAFLGYDKLFTITDDIFYQYYAANMEYMLGRYSECLNRVNDCIDNRSKYSAQRVLITFELGNGVEKAIDVYAAFFNLKGVLLLQSDNKQEAANFFNKALEIMPDFPLAQQNLSALQSEHK